MHSFDDLKLSNWIIQRDGTSIMVRDGISRATIRKEIEQLAKNDPDHTYKTFPYTLTTGEYICAKANLMVTEWEGLPE